MFVFSSYFVTIVCLSSCKKGSPSWDVDVLAPLVRSTLSINNIVPDSLTHVNADNSVDIVYNTSLFTLNTDSLFKISDTTLNNTYTAPFQNVVAPGGAIIPVVSNNIKNNLGAVQLTNVNLREGKMLLTISSGIHGLVDFNYRIPSAKNAAGKVFDTTVTIPPAVGATPGVYSGTFDLSGYKLDLTLPVANVNTLATSYSAAVTAAANGGTTTTINAGDAVQISNSFEKMIVEYAKGYFGNTSANAQDSTPVSMFSHVMSGSLNWENIDIDFSIENSIGVDGRITINDISSVNTRTGNTVPLTHPVIGSPINLNRAVDNGGNVNPSLYKFSIKPSSPSNILAFINNLPDKMSYNMNFEINPLGNVSGSNDFIYYSKLLKTQMNMTIPLSVIANDLTLADTMDFSMGKETDNVNYGTLYLYADNGFPFTAEAQLYIMDENFSITDSLISAPNIILAPALDANYICVGKQANKLAIPVNVDKMSLLRHTKKLMLKIKFNTAGQPNYVKVYSYYEIVAKLVADFNYTVNKK